MNAQNWSRFGAAIMVIAVVGQIAAAESGRPSRATLADMGLGGLVVMSDDEAQSIRGQGYSSARAFGNSFATINTPIGGAHSEDGYTSSGKHFAAGGSYSKAGVSIKSSKGRGGHNGGPGYGGMGGGHTKTTTIKFFARGGSWAAGI